jgi:hypothetical protein
MTHVHVQVTAEDAPQDALERGHPRAVDSTGHEPGSEGKKSAVSMTDENVGRRGQTLD